MHFVMSAIKCKATFGGPPSLAPAKLHAAAATRLPVPATITFALLPQPILVQTGRTQFSAHIANWCLACLATPTTLPHRACSCF